jgi:peptidoglycan/LPS O-acetylase OafA/YrhL
MIPSIAGVTSMAGHFWTLEVELVFYLMVAALFLAIGKLGWKVILPVFILVGALYVESPKFSFEDHWHFIMLYLAVMFWGASCREIMQFSFDWLSRFIRVNVARAIAIGLASGLLLIRPLKSAYFGIIEENTSLLQFNVSVSLGILLFLFWVVLTPVHSTILARFGRWTYSTYLLHAVVFYGLIQIITEWDLTLFQGWPLMV